MYSCIQKHRCLCALVYTVTDECQEKVLKKVDFKLFLGAMMKK